MSSRSITFSCFNNFFTNCFANCIKVTYNSHPDPCQYSQQRQHRNQHKNEMKQNKKRPKIIEQLSNKSDNGNNEIKNEPKSDLEHVLRVSSCRYFGSDDERQIVGAQTEMETWHSYPRRLPSRHTSNSSIGIQNDSSQEISSNLEEDEKNTFSNQTRSKHNRHSSTTMNKSEQGEVEEWWSSTLKLQEVYFTAALNES